MTERNDRENRPASAAPHPPRRPARRLSRIRLLALLVQLHDPRATAAVIAAATIFVAAAVGLYAPAIGRLQAMTALLVAPPLVALFTLRWALAERGWLRRASLGVGGAGALVALVVLASAVAPGPPLARLRLSDGVTGAPVESPATARWFTLVVAADVQGGDGTVQLGLRRGDQQTRVVASLDHNAAADEESLGAGQRARRRIAGVHVPGEGPVHVRFDQATGATGPTVEVTVRTATWLDRHAVPALSFLGLAAVALQVWAERRRARSWQLLGTGIAVALAAYGPYGYDPAAPGRSALGILAFAALAGGGGALVLSFIIAKAFESRHQRATVPSSTGG